MNNQTLEKRLEVIFQQLQNERVREKCVKVMANIIRDSKQEATLEDWEKNINFELK